MPVLVPPSDAPPPPGPLGGGKSQLLFLRGRAKVPVPKVQVSASVGAS